MGALRQIGAGGSIGDQQAGVLATPDFAPQSVIGLSSSRQYFVRFVPKRNMHITLIAFWVSVASGTDDPCDVGAYDATLTKLGSSGATTGKLNSTGLKTIAPTPFDLRSGQVYYASFAAASTATLVSATYSVNGVQTLFGSNAPQAEMLFLTAGYPLGAGPITPSGNLSGAPVLALRES